MTKIWPTAAFQFSHPNHGWFKWFQVISSDFKWFQDRRPGLHWNQMPHLLQSELACPPGEDFFLWAQWGHVYPFVVSADIWLMEKVFLSLVVSSTRLPGATFASICISTQALPNAVKSFSGLLHALDCDICIKRIQKWTPKPQQALVCASVHMDTLNLLFAETNISVRWHYLEAGLWFCDVEFHFAFCHDSNCTGPLNQTPAVWGKVAMWASCNFWRVCPTSKLWMFGMKKNWHRLFQIPEKKHSDSMIQFWRLSLPSPYWDSMIYIYI